MLEQEEGGRFCASCGTKNKPGARFCASCGKPMAVVDSSADATAPSPSHLGVPPAAQPQYSPDGKWWWNGRAWTAVASAPIAFAAPSPVNKKKRMSFGKRLAIGLCVLAVATSTTAGILWATGEFKPATSTPGSADRGLGPGPYYSHYNCQGDAGCMASGFNELTAPGGGTAIFLDYKDLASCQQSLTQMSVISAKWWCSTSKNPKDTGP